MTTTVLVEGLTCQHCVNAVTEELTAIPSVTEVSVDLKKGEPSPVTITSGEDLSPVVVAEAIAEAGYSVVGEN